MPQDVFKILKDLELKAVGLDPQGNQMQQGYFASFRPIGLPIDAQDFQNPYSPQGGDLNKPTTTADPKDPATVTPVTGSATLTEKSISISGIGQSQQALLNTFLLIDNKLQMNNTYEVIPSSSKISDSWFAIISGANGIPQTTGYAPDVQKAYDAANAVLKNTDGTITPHYQQYIEFQQKYSDALKAYHRAYAACFTNPDQLQTWPELGIDYDNDVQNALTQWETLGFKTEIESALATLAAKGSDPSMALINQAKNRFNSSLLEFTAVGQIPYTVLLPGNWYDKDNDDGWNQYTSTDFHYQSNYSESDTAYGGGGGFSVGFWSVGGGFNSSSQQTNLNIQTNNLNISFSYCVVDVNRPWLDTTLLNLKAWFLMGNYKAGCISDGTMGQQLTQDKVEPLFLPSVITSLILIKDVSISWDNWQADWATAQSSVSESTSVGWGPFAVTGSYTHHDESRSFTCDASGEALVIPGVQVIGYISAINPLSPSVDSDKYVNVINQ